VASLVCSCLGIIPVVGLVMDIVGISLGVSARRQIRKSDGWLVGDGIARAGIIVGTALLAMGIVVALGNSVLNIIIATMIINLPFYCRFARSAVNVRRDLGYVEAARMGGNGSLMVLINHIIPNILPPMMVQASLNMGWAILNAAGLSFIGLGVRPPTPEWGIMVSEGASYIISGEWWAFMFPGAALVLAVFSFNMLGDGLRDLLDPRKRV